MSIVKKDPAAKTVGVSPKVAYPTVALVALGVVLCILDKIGVIDTPDELWIGLLGAGAGVGGIGYSAPPPVVAPKESAPSKVIT
jgi:hypothetical protein